MSLRPPIPAAARGAVARDRMARGRGYFSESHIPVPGGVRRSRQAGAPATAPAFLGFWDESTESGTTLEAYFWDTDTWLSEDLNGTTTNHLEPVAGATAVVWATAIGQAVVVPSGWTTVASGYYGDTPFIHWAIATTTAGASTDWTFGVAGAATQIGAVCFFFTGTGTLDAALDATGIGTTIGVLVEPDTRPGEWIAWASSPRGATLGAVHCDDLDPAQTGITFPYMYHSRLDGVLTYGFSLPGSAQALGGVLTGYEEGGLHSATVTTDWVIARFGWA